MIFKNETDFYFPILAIADEEPAACATAPEEETSETVNAESTIADILPLSDFWFSKFHGDTKF